MGEREELIRNLRQLIELERVSGVEFVPAPRSQPAVRSAESAPLAPAVVAARAAPPALAMQTAAPITSAQSPPASPPHIAETTASTAILAASTGLPAAALAAIAAEIAGCQRCTLCSTRANTVPGEGQPAPELLFVGEGPGADEDAQGRPFVGAAGQLLTKMIEAMGFARSDVFIANVVKCRPPGNRTPEPDEVTACMPYLERQILVLKPKVICTLGNTPLRALMGDDKLGITRLRGQALSWRDITMIPTFHPSYLLRNPSAKKLCWEDLQVVLKALGRTPPKRSR